MYYLGGVYSWLYLCIMYAHNSHTSNRVETPSLTPVYNPHSCTLIKYHGVKICIYIVPKTFGVDLFNLLCEFAYIHLFWS